MNPKNIKIIHVEHCSHSYFVKDWKNLDEVVKGSWGTQVATELKKAYFNMNIEGWFPEKIEKNEREFYYKGIKMRIFPTTFSPRYALDFSLPMLKALKKEIKKAKKDKIKLIIHVHEIHNLHGLIIATFFKNQNLICQHHGGSWPFKHLRNKKYKRYFPLFFIGQIWENLVLKNVKSYFALSKDEIEYLKKKAPNSRVKFQTMGISDEYFEKMSKKKARKILGLNPNKKIFIFIGRINKEKGIKYLLDAMKELNDVELKIIGYTQEIDEFKEYAKKNNLKNVEFLGGVFGERKLLFISSADGLILPSLKEGAPVTVMEALARGTPVIVTDVGGIPLMVKNKREGIMIKQRNSKEIIRAINELIEHPLKDVSKYATVYKWENIVEDTLKEYRRL